MKRTKIILLGFIFITTMIMSSCRALDHPCPAYANEKNNIEKIRRYD